MMLFLNWIFFHVSYLSATEKGYPPKILSNILNFLTFVYLHRRLVYIFNGKTPKEMPPISLYTVNLYQSFSVSIYISSGIQNSLSPKE